MPSHAWLRFRGFCWEDEALKLYGCGMFSLPAMSIDVNGSLGSSADPRSICDSMGSDVVNGVVLG